MPFWRVIMDPVGELKELVAEYHRMLDHAMCFARHDRSCAARLGIGLKCDCGWSDARTKILQFLMRVKL